MLLSMTASAQQAPEETESPPLKEIEKHVFNYGDHDSSCIRWTDKCRTCNRGISPDIIPARPTALLPHRSAVAPPAHYLPTQFPALVLSGYPRLERVVR
jgi:hypothetical protein